MKLRNKKTGKIISTSSGEPINLFITDDFNRIHYLTYSSLAELNAEWEDYEPKEPLIKDKKIRKAVIAWAEANDIDTRPSEQRVEYNFAENRLTWIATCIEFNESRSLENLNDGETYTIAELCGEEE